MCIISFKHFLFARNYSAIEENNLRTTNFLIAPIPLLGKRGILCI